MTIEFRPITTDNREEILKLSVSDNQLTFIESIAQCLEEADNDDCWRPVGIYIDGVPVGFSMYCYWAGDLPDGRVWLDRYLIDATHQGKGYGKLALPLLMNIIHQEYDCSHIYLSVYENNRAAIALYEQFGFVFHGEVDEKGELVMVWTHKDVCLT